MFQSLDIKNFRGFGHLQLEGLGAVNLVVGKNNTGKTSLLEGITLLADHSSLDGLLDLFRTKPSAVDERYYQWLIKEGVGPDGASLAALSAESGERRLVLAVHTGRAPATASGLVVAKQAHQLMVWCTNQMTQRRTHAVSVQHGDPDSLVDAFAKAVRSPSDENEMETVLASVDPRIKSVRLDSVQKRPFIVVDVGLSSRVPLSHAGQGIYRLVDILSELLGNKPQQCCLDELENGIHYSVLPQVWKGLAEISSRLGIQIFATTHSWECLEAAHEAFSSRESYDFRVIQLYRVGDESIGRVLDREHIEAAIAGDIEVR